MKLNSAFAYLYDKGNDTVLLHTKQQTLWNCHREWPKPFTCAVTALSYYAAAGPCYTCNELPGILISGEGIIGLRREGFSTIFKSNA